MTRATRIAFLAAFTATALMLSPGSQAMASSEGHHIERQTWSFGGFGGQYEAPQLQRGFQIYKDVCSACHGLKRVYFRNLVQRGGPEFPEEGAKALAAEWPNKVTDGPDDAGKMFERPAKLFDPILGPYKNDKEARAAQNGALPPDLSVIAKARNVEYTGTFWAHPFSMLRDIATSYQEGGPDYIYALLTGYAEKAPAYKRDAAGHLDPVGEADGVAESAVERCAMVVLGEAGKPDTCNKVQDGMLYNRAFPGHQIAMPPPLATDNFVKYQDGSGSLDQNARDIAAFLAWAADPSLSERKHTGWLVMIYLLVTTVLLYVGKKRVWAKVH
jgi:cytochrome c1